MNNGNIVNSSGKEPQNKTLAENDYRDFALATLAITGTLNLLFFFLSKVFSKYCSDKFQPEVISAALFITATVAILKYISRNWFRKYGIKIDRKLIWIACLSFLVGTVSGFGLSHIEVIREVWLIGSVTIFCEYICFWSLFYEETQSETT